jgi:RHH-type rel operon transcriptional repressor/antitoxin RelB
MTTVTTVALSVTLPSETKERLERLATEAATSPSELAAEAIRSYLDLQEWQVEEIRAGVREADAGEFASADEVRSVFAKWTRVG